MKTQSIRINILIYDIIFADHKSQNKGQREGQEERKQQSRKERKDKERGGRKKKPEWYLAKVNVPSMPQPLVPLTHRQPAN